MRILLIHNYYQHFGGEDSVVQQEFNELSKSNTVKLVTSQNKRGIKGFIQFLLYPFNIFETNRILNEVQAFQPDIVHIHNMHYALGPYIIRALRKKQIPVVMTLHNFRIICPSATLFFKNQLFTKSLEEDFPWSAVKLKTLDNSFLKTFITASVYWLHKKLGTWNQVNQFLVLSEFSKNLLCTSKLGLSESKFTVKPNFASVSSQIEKSTANYFIYIGRLSSEKGILQLLEAISKTDYQIKIFGTGPLEKKVAQIATKHTNIELNGFQSLEVLRENLVHAEALVVPSICYEGMPMTILDAFALGTPVLCSSIGNLQEMVVPLYTGLHFNPYSSQDIQDTLKKWTNVSTADKGIISKNCIETYKEKYTASKNINLLLNVYQKAINQNVI